MMTDDHFQVFLGKLETFRQTFMLPSPTPPPRPPIRGESHPRRNAKQQVHIELASRVNS